MLASNGGGVKKTAPEAARAGSAVAQIVSVRGSDPQRRGGATLDRLVALLERDLDRVNTLILERMQSPVALIPQLAGHIIAAGGKRLRPMLTLAAARLCGYPGDRHIALAAAVEFIHTATLLHDDVVGARDQGEPEDHGIPFVLAIDEQVGRKAASDGEGHRDLRGYVRLDLHRVGAGTGDDLRLVRRRTCAPRRPLRGTARPVHGRRGLLRGG